MEGGFRFGLYIYIYIHVRRVCTAGYKLTTNHFVSINSLPTYIYIYI